MDQRLGSRRQLVGGNATIDIIVALEPALDNHVEDIGFIDLDNLQEGSLYIAGRSYRRSGQTV